MEIPKTIPGVFTDIYWDPDWKVLQVTPDGQEVAFQQFGKCYILRLNEGRFIPYAPVWASQYDGRLSPDHTLAFSNVPDFNDATSNMAIFTALPDPKPNYYAGVLTRLYDNKWEKVFVDTNFIVGINDQNQLIVSNAWTRDQRVAGLRGLRLIDPKTYKVLKILRTDTIYNNLAQTPIYHPTFYFNSTYTALLGTETGNGNTRIYPFGSDSVINTTLGQTVRRHVMSDEHYIYMVAKDALSVFSMHTGKLLYTATYSPAAANAPYNYRRCLYALAGNGRLYRYDREQATVYEEEVTPTSLHTIKTYPLHTDNTPLLPAEPWYEIAACAGPSLIIVPRLRVDGDVPENAGYVINLPSGKVSLKIAPFFNVNAEQIAKEIKFQESERAYELKQKADKIAAEKTAIAKEQQDKYAECDRIINEAKMKIGTYYPIGALVYKNDYGSNCRKGYAIWGFNCETKHFTAAGLGTYDANADKSYYTLCDIGPYGICPECNGHPISTNDEYIKDDNWHQTNFNVYTLNPNAVKKVTVTTTCKRCGGKGIVKL